MPLGEAGEENKTSCLAFSLRFGLSSHTHTLLVTLLFTELCLLYNTASQFIAYSLKPWSVEKYQCDYSILARTQIEILGKIVEP